MAFIKPAQRSTNKKENIKQFKRCSIAAGELNH